MGVRINNGQIRRTYQLFDAHGFTKQQQLEAIHKKYAKTRVKDLGFDEAREFITHLDLELQKSLRKSRGTVIHYLCLLGFTTTQDTPDYDRINAFVVNIGSNNPRKKILNFLYANELNKVVTQVKAMYSKEMKR